MFSGGMSGSTSSGLKVARIAVFLKSIRQEIRRMVNPDRAVPIKFEGRELGNQEQRSIAFYLMTYLGVFLVLLALISLDTKTFASAFSGVISTLNNVGGDLDLLGPAVDYAHLHDRTKLIMCLAMIMGRLEIYPVLILFSPATWHKT
jgi:trk system potassium uptake protein TrkH